MSASDLLVAFEADPSQHKAFEEVVVAAIAEEDRATLLRVYEQLPKWAPDPTSRLVQVLAKQARMAAESPLAGLLHFHNGLVAWKHYDDPRKAEMSFRKIKEAPEDPELLREFYLDFYVAQNQWRKLEQFLANPDLGGMDEVGARRLLAPLAEERGAIDKAISFWQSVFKASPEEPAAEQALRRLYVDNEKWAAMIDLLKRSLTRLGSDEASEKIALHREIIDIYKEHLKAPPKIIAEWQSILKLDPQHGEALEALAAEFESMRRWHDLVKILKQQVELQDEEEPAILLHERIATLMLERFNNVTDAVTHYNYILELEPTHGPAITRLKALYEQRCDFDNYIRIAEREVLLLEDDAERDAAYIALARLASEKIRKPAVPIQMWEQVLDTNAEHEEALTHLEQLYERERAYDKLTLILNTRAELSDDDTKASLLEKLGLIYATRLKDAERATESWRRLLEVNPSHRKAMVELKRRYTATRDWENLEWFFRHHGTVQEWGRTLEKESRSIEAPKERTELLFRAATIWQEEVGEAHRAIRTLESILDLDPEHGRAAGMLIPLYRQLNAWPKLPDVYSIALEHTEDATARRDLLLALAEVHETHLNDLEQAFFRYREAIAETPSDAELRPELRRLAEASNNWESYVSILDEVGEHLDDTEQQIEVLLEAGAVYSDRLDEPEMALEYFTQITAVDESHPIALKALEGIYRRQGDFQQLVGILSLTLAHAQESEQRKAIQLDLAQVFHTDLGQNDEAIAIYQSMLEEHPDDLRAHEALIDLFLHEERFTEVHEVLLRKRDVLVADDADTRRLADTETQLGMLTYGTDVTEGSLESALDHYEMALCHQAGHPEAVKRLEELLASEPHRTRISQLLTPVYERSETWTKLADVYEIQWLAAQADEDQATQIQHLELLADIYDAKLENQDLAWRSYGRLFELQPSRSDVRREFKRLTGALSRWHELLALYTAHCDQPEEAEARLAIKLDIAQTWQRRVEDRDQALAFYHQVLDEEPEHKESLDALEQLYTELDRAEKLLEIYQSRVKLASDEDVQLDYLFRISDLLRVRLDRPEDAIGAIHQVLEIRPNEARALLSLDELYTMCGRWDDLTANIEVLIGQADGDDARQSALKTRLAGIVQHQLEDVPRAVQIYQEILSEHADNQAVLEALEGLFTQEDHRALIAPILQPYYERHAMWVKLIEVYQARANTSQDLAESIAWHYKIANRYEEALGQDANAFAQYQKTFALDPGKQETLDELLRLASQLGEQSYEELIVVLESHVEDIDDPAQCCRTHRTIAQLAQHETGDLACAEKHLQALLDIDPADSDAVDALIALFRQQDNHAKLVTTLTAKAESVTDEALRRDLYAEAGEISAKVLNKPELALQLFEELKRLEPGETRALDALEALYAQVEQWDDLIELYRQRIEMLTEDEDSLDARKHYARLMGRTQATRLEDGAEDAVATWRQLLDWDPTDTDALQELDTLYSHLEDWFNLLEVLQTLQSTADDAEWPMIQFRIAKLYEGDEQLDQPREAIAAYEQLLARDRDHEGALDSLRYLVETSEERELAFDVLRPLLHEQDAFDDLWEQYETIASHQADEPGRQVDTLHAMATLAEEHLGDITRAFEAHSKAFQIDPRHTNTNGELERLASDNSLWEQLVSVYLTDIEEADETLVLTKRLRAGAIIMEEIGNPERAIEIYAAIHEDAEDNEEALERLHTLYEEQGHYEELSRILRHQIDLRAELPAKTEALAKLAQINEEHLDDADSAVEAYMEILFAEDANTHAVAELHRLFTDVTPRLDISDQLESIYQRDEQWSQLLTLWERKLEILSDPSDQLELMRQLAQLNLEHLQAEDMAFIWLGKAFRCDAEDDGILSSLETLSASLEAWADFVETLLAGAEATEDDDRKVQLWTRAAELTRDALEDPSEAEQILRLVLSIDDEHLPTLRSLDTLCVARERWTELEPVLVTIAAATDSDSERITVLERLASLYNAQLENRAQAVDAYRQILDIDDRHGGALLALHQVYEEEERWPELFEILKQLEAVAEDNEARAEHTSHMARIAENRLHLVEEAIDLWEQVLMAAPAHSEAIAELQRLHESRGDWDALVNAYDRELRMDTADAVRRLELTRAMGRVLVDKLEEPEQALPCWEKARTLAPDDDEVLLTLQTLYRDTYQQPQLASVIADRITSETTTTEESLVLWRELAQLRAEALGDPSGAVEAWHAVVEADPEDSEAIENLDQLYEQLGRWEDAVTLGRRRLEFTEDEESRIQIWMDIANLQKHQLEDSAAAAATYADILSFKPTHMDASYQLEALYEQGEQWSDLAPLLLDRSEHLEDIDEKITALQQLATLLEDQLTSPNEAFHVIRKAVLLVPEDNHNLAHLERLAEVTNENWLDLLSTYEELIDDAKDEEAPLELLLKAAGIHEQRLEQGSEAATYYRRALDIDSEHEGALRALVSLQEQLGRWPTLVVHLQQLAELTMDNSERIVLLAKAAAVYELELDELDAAVLTWQAVLDADENHQEAVNELERLHEAMSAWRDLVNILEHRIQINPADEVALRLRIAGILENEAKLNQLDEAIKVYEEILDLDPRNEQALDALQEIYGDRQDWEPLISLFERSMAAAPSEEDRIDLCVKIGILHSGIGNADEAIDAYQRVLYMQPAHAEALDELERLLTEAERWEDLVDLYERRKDVAESSELRVDALTSMAQLYLDQLQDLDGAMQSYERASNEDPSRLDVLEALEALYHREELWDQLIATLERMLTVSDNREDRVSLLCRQGILLTRTLGDYDGATQRYHRALDEDATCLQAHDALVELYQETGNYDQVVETLNAKLTVCEGMAKARVHVTLAEILRERLSDMDAALEHLEHAETEAPESAEVLWPLAQYHMHAGDWTKAAPRLDVLADTLNESADQEHLATVHRYRGQAAEAIYDPDRALDAYQLAASLGSPDQATLDGLARLHFKRGDYEEAEQFYQSLIERFGESIDTDVLARAYLELGQASLQLGRMEEAETHLAQVFELQPDSTDAMRRIIEVFESSENWRMVLTYQERLLDLTSEPFDRFTLHQSMGNIYQERLNDLAAAVEAYEAAMSEGAFSREPLIQMFQIFAAAQDYNEAIRALNELIKHENEPGAKVKWAQMIAVMYRDHLDDVDQAVRYYNLMLDHDITQLEAFEAIDEMLTSTKKFKAQRDNYRRMLQRVLKYEGELPNQAQLLFKLYFALGEVYRSRMRDYDNAVSAFTLASSTDPQDTKSREILAELYEQQGGSELPKAIDEHRALIRLNPRRTDSYHRIVSLSQQIGAHDRAWTTSGLLIGLGKANDRETELYEEHLNPGMLESDHSLDGIWYSHVMPKGMDGHFDRIFELAYRILDKQNTRHAIKDFGLKKRDRIDLKEQTLFNTTFKTVARILGLSELPNLYRGAQPGLTPLPITPLAIQVGPDMLQGLSPKKLAFHLAKFLTYYRPAFKAAKIRGRQDLDLLYLAASALDEDRDELRLPTGIAQEDLEKIQEVIGEYRDQLDKTLSATERTALVHAVREHEHAEQRSTVGAWLRHIELAANHAALLICDDVAETIKHLKGQREKHATETMKELFNYVLSDRYLDSRKRLGASVEAP